MEDMVQKLTLEMEALQQEIKEKFGISPDQVFTTIIDLKKQISNLEAERIALLNKAEQLVETAVAV